MRNTWIKMILVAAASLAMVGCGGDGEGVVQLDPNIQKIVSWSNTGINPPTEADYSAAGVNLHGHSADEINEYIRQLHNGDKVDTVAGIEAIARELGVTLVDSDGDGIYDAFDDTPHGGGGSGDGGDTNGSVVVSQAGIHVALSEKLGESISWDTNLHPLLHKSRLYLYHTTVEVSRENDTTYRDINYSVKSYNLASFNSDKNMSDLAVSTIYNHHVKVDNLHTYGFDVKHLNLTKQGDYLYFSTNPDTLQSKTQGSLIKYDMGAQAQVYHAKNDATNGYDTSKGETIDDGSYFDLTRGWFVPFDDSHIGVVEGNVAKVVNSDDGSSLVIGLPYFSGPTMKSSTYMYGSPISNNERYFHIERNTPAGYNGLLNVKYIADNAGGDVVKLGYRDITNEAANRPGNSCQADDIACIYQNPNYKLTRIPDDFRAKYTGSKIYDYSGSEYSVNVQNQNMFLDGNKLYIPMQIQIKSDNPPYSYDSFILEYGMDSTLEEIHFLESEDETILASAIYEFVKYGDIIYYKGRDKQDKKKSLLKAYDLKNKKFLFTYDITQEKSMNNGQIPQEYIVTGDTIIIPHKMTQSESTYYYDMAFDIINSHTGKLLKRVTHDALKGFHSEYYSVSEGVVSDRNSVYFLFGLKNSDDHFKRTVLVKIDSENNKVIKEQYRYNNHMTGVAKASAE